MKKLNVNSKIFIERSKAVHGDKYDYSLVKYRGASKKVEIGCKRHDVFLQTPSQHLSGKGCPFCASNKLTRDEFLERTKQLYGESYNYSRCTYTHKTGLNDYITITCKTHGDFRAKVNAFLKGYGCPKCSRDEKQKRKQIAKQNPNSTSVLETDAKNTMTTYPVIIRFTASESHVKACFWSEPFKTKPEAVEFSDSIKVCLELASCVDIESVIIEKKQKYLTWDEAAKLIRWLNLESKDEYDLWWDELQPTFIPRNLLENYPNIEKVFTGSEIGTILSIINKARIPYFEERQIA